jgi:hypothetical protein
MNKYQFAKGYKEFDEEAITAQDAGEELERIHAKRGRLDSQGVVDESRPEDAPLHTAFEWNDEIAAESYRRVQALDLIRVVEVVKPAPDERKPEPAYVNVSTKAPEYQRPAVVARSPRLFESAYRQACERLIAAEKAMEHLQEIAKREQPDVIRQCGKAVYVLRELRALLPGRP